MPKAALPLGILVLIAGQAAASPMGCDVVRPKQGSETSLRMLDGPAIRTSDNHLQFGFNLEWKTFQSDLFSESTSQVRPDAVKWLASMPGMVYRYPGGTVANYLHLIDSIGPQTGRSKQKAVDWDAAQPMTFGLDEYLSFLDAVKGKPWIVANVFGSLDGARPIAGLADRAGALATKLQGAHRPLRWELGNELYLDRYQLSPVAYAERASTVTSAVASRQADARFVIGLSDFNTRQFKKDDYNNALLGAALPETLEFAQHSYYDGPPGGPPVDNRLNEVCRTIALLQSRPRAEQAVWITEHARWPGGKTSDPDWRSLWWKSNNLEAAIGMADYVLGLAAMPVVKGAFVHSLAGTRGPWSLFIENGNGGLVPSAVLLGIQLMSPLGGLDVAPTELRSTNRSRYAGGYDVRAVVARDTASGGFSVFAVNRATQVTPMQLSMSVMASKRVTAKLRTLTGASVDANNTAAAPNAVAIRDSALELVFDGTGNANIQLPASSVIALIF